MTFVPFSHAHVLPAARLVADGVARLRRRVPALPASWTDPPHVARVLAGLADRGTGLAALDDGRLVAFQSAVTLDGRGGRWTYTPDVAHAAPPDPAGRLRARLYGALAERWIHEACAEHVVAVAVDDEPAASTYAAIGFGHHVRDLISPLRPVERGPLPAGISIRRAGPADASVMAGLDAALRRHLESAPVFLRPGASPSPEVWRGRLADPAVATFLAERAGEAVAFLGIGPCATDVATIVRDRGTASVTGAFTRPEARGAEVGSHLLAAAVAWAEAEGYERWAVDHETANGEASRFWARHATPVTLSLSRRLAPGLVAR